MASRATERCALRACFAVNRIVRIALIPGARSR
jgi:hypothetical protein